MDSIISLLIDLLSWLFNSATKKKENEPNSPSNAPPRVPPSNRPGQSQPANAPPQTQRKAVSWEDELRRLLGEEAPLKPLIPPARTPPKAPPTIVPRPVAAPPVSQPASRPPPVIARASVLDVVPLPVPAVERVSTTDLAKLDESRKAYERASQLDILAAERIRKTPGQPVGLTSVVTRKTQSDEATETLSFMKNKRGAREGIIASIILGPPRGLEEMV